MSSPENIMRQAIDLAAKAGEKGHYPVSAIITNNRYEVLASAGCTLIDSHDPSMHPEMTAIREACANIKDRYLPDTYLFTTMEPCPMCASVAIWAKMKGIYFATNQADAYKVADKLKGTIYTFRQIDVPAIDIVKKGNPVIELYENFMREDMLRVYDDFVDHVRSQ